MKGVVDFSDWVTIDPTPDSAPELVVPIPSILFAKEDEIRAEVVNLNDYFNDDTWYYYVYSPRPSQMGFEVIYNSDPGNVTLEIATGQTCGGTCVHLPGTILVIPKSNWNGAVQVQVRATDWRGKTTTSNLFQISVEPLNDIPIVGVSGLESGSTVDIYKDEEHVFNVTVWDDSGHVYIEARLDDGEWEHVGQTMACSDDRESVVGGMPRCTTQEYKFSLDEHATGENYTLELRACDGDYCSNDFKGGRYALELEDNGHKDVPASLTSQLIALALIMVVMVALIWSGIFHRRKV
jgi:hypothetical protein